VIEPRIFSRTVHSCSRNGDVGAMEENMQVRLSSALLITLACSCNAPETPAPPSRSPAAAPPSRPDQVPDQPHAPGPVAPRITETDKAREEDERPLSPVTAAKAPTPRPREGDEMASSTTRSESDANREASCQAKCNGELRKALKGRIVCVCRTKDAGRTCRDGNECEGECLADGARKEVTAEGPPQRGFFIGNCSEFKSAIGCYRVIPSGTLKHGPIPLDEPPPTICID
jgi:hypothetical protein